MNFGCGPPGGNHRLSGPSTARRKANAERNSLQGAPSSRPCQIGVDQTALDLALRHGIPRTAVIAERANLWPYLAIET